MRSFIATLLLCLFFGQSSAQARQHQSAPAVTFDRHAVSGAYRYGVQQATPRIARVKAKRKAKRTASRHRHYHRARVAVRGEVTLLPHPAGCPARAFCGCGAALEVFGRNIRELWLARNWFQFPEADPAPRMVAVRRHHVFVLRRHVVGDRWLAYDANSGGRKTRLHVRSIAGYSIRNPHAGRRYAQYG